MVGHTHILSFNSLVPDTFQSTNTIWWLPIIFGLNTSPPIIVFLILCGLELQPSYCKLKSYVGWKSIRIQLNHIIYLSFSNKKCWSFMLVMFLIIVFLYTLNATIGLGTGLHAVFNFQNTLNWNFVTSFRVLLNHIFADISRKTWDSLYIPIG